jgi:hypothetical protein
MRRIALSIRVLAASRTRNGLRASIVATISMLLHHLAREVGTARLVGTRHARGAMQKLPQVLERADQEGITRDLSDGAVKAQVFVRAVAAFGHGRMRGLDRISDTAHVGFRAAFGRDLVRQVIARGKGLEADEHERGDRACGPNLGTANRRSSAEASKYGQFDSFPTMPSPGEVAYRTHADAMLSL